MYAFGFGHVGISRGIEKLASAGIYPTVELDCNGLGERGEWGWSAWVCVEGDRMENG